MGEIQFLNQYPADKRFTYDERISLLRNRKIEQTVEKSKNGGADEDDYGLIKQDVFHYKLKPNHENGSIYGYEAWADNYCSILKEHPLYLDPLDAFVGKGFLFLERLRPADKKWNPEYAYPELQKIFDKYNIISGIDNCHHFTPDLQIGFELGWGGILKKLKEQKELHDATHYAFYDNEIKVVEAIIAFLERVSQELFDASKLECNYELKQNLIEMARINKNVAANPPKTFREAIQWMCWFSMLSRTYNRGSAGGQLDEMLRPYYENDIQNSILTDDEAVFYLACLFLQDSRYFQLGGPDIAGNDMTSKISYLCLDAADKINIACNLTIRVHDKLDKDFFKKSVAYLFKNKQGWPRYSSDSALAEGFMKCGYSLELARKRVAAGCHWMCIPGMEYTMNDTVKINLAKVFEVSYYEMINTSDNPSAETLFKIYGKHLKAAVDATGNGIMHHLKYQTKSQPELILNLFQHGLIEKGVNITDGGANFYNMCVDGSGIAVVADSFSACEQRIDIERKLSYQELTAHMLSNFEDKDGEYIRQLLQHSERYGGGDTLGDQWAKRISQLYTSLVRDLNNQHKGINFIPGFFSWSNTIGLGKTVSATPNGRKSGTPINHGANPLGGFRKDGAVSSMCNAIAAIQPGYGNCAPVQLEFDPGIVNDDEGICKMVDMIKTIMDTGNTLLNINIIDAEKILEADKDPLKYPDLVVRVTGFTAFFAMLSPDFRKLVVDRVTAVNGNKIKEFKER
ncbi:MAG: pyruvate formate lyase family protein [Clostridia bacterium]|nr:pyruvate formate lyase family protein [Clostridia bacterium]